MKVYAVLGVVVLAVISETRGFGFQPMLIRYVFKFQLVVSSRLSSVCRLRIEARTNLEKLSFSRPTFEWNHHYPLMYRRMDQVFGDLVSDFYDVGVFPHSLITDYHRIGCQHPPAKQHVSTRYIYDYYNTCALFFCKTRPTDGVAWI